MQSMIIDIMSSTGGNDHARSEIEQLVNTLEQQKSAYEAKCGAVEYELEEYREMCRKSMEEHKRRFDELFQENNSLSEEVKELRSTVEYYKTALQEETRRNSQVDVYLTRLPTMEEHADVLHKLKLSEQRQADLQKQLEITRSELEQCESRFSNSRVQLERCQDRERILQTQLDAAIERLHPRSEETGQTSNSSYRVTPEFVDDLRSELNRYRSSFAQVKKLLEAETHRAEAADSCLRMTKRQFEEQLAREAASITGLKTTLTAKHKEIHHLKTRISELNTEKQELLAQLLNCKSALSRSNQAWSSTEGKQRGRLLRHLVQTVNELDKLVTQLTQLVDGQKPDLACLLFESQLLEEWSNESINACNSTLPVDESAASTIGSECKLSLPHYNMNSDGSQHHFVLPELRTQMEQVQKIREKLCVLRQKLSDRYAEHLGEKLECTVQ